MLALVAEWWWIAPAGAGAGALGVAGLLARRPSGHRLELDAALHDLREAQHTLARSRAQVEVARAELLRAQAERSDSGSAVAGPAEARRRVQVTERAVKVAVAELKARRAAVHAARATMPAGRAPLEAMPLARLRAEHDAITARWIAYETDAAKAIDYPAMSDPASPTLRAFLREQQRALELRPTSADARMTPREFAAYRDAVRRATQSFEQAETAARRSAGELPAADRDGVEWGIARDLLETAQDALVRSAHAWQQARKRRAQG